jgi:hypothetical protein
MTIQIAVKGTPGKTNLIRPMTIIGYLAVLILAKLVRISTGRAQERAEVLSLMSKIFTDLAREDVKTMKAIVVGRYEILVESNFSKL